MFGRHTCLSRISDFVIYIYVISLLTLRSIAIEGESWQIRQNELDCRDTAPLNHLAFQMCTFHFRLLSSFFSAPSFLFLGFYNWLPAKWTVLIWPGVKNETDLCENCAIWETIAVCDEGERKWDVFTRKKRLLHGLFFFIQIRRNKCVMFWRSLHIWITANGSIYKISALVDIFHFQFSTSIPPRTLLATPIKTKIWILSIPELPPFQPEVNRGKQLVATWFTLVAPKTENLFSIYDEKKKKC